ncbi:MAG: cysteine hydrolase [Chloroflexi bacterium]|nr:cysteine hydrolase [Chloroflexota bacterium]
MPLKDQWTIVLGETACLTIDLQAAYLEPGSPRECPEGRKLVPMVNELTDLCRRLQIPVVHLRNYFRPDLSDMGLLSELREQTDSELEATAGKRGTEFYQDLNILPTDYIVNKVRNSAFIAGASSLEPLLRGLGVKTLIACGVMTDVCVFTTVANAMMLGFRVWLVGDLTATLGQQRQKAALEALDSLFAKVVTFAQVRDELKTLIA